MKYRQLISLGLLALLLTACRSHNDEPRVARQTVLVYMAGDNNLDSFVMDDVNEMMAARRNLPDDCDLILFIDKVGPLPCFMKVTKGDTVRMETCKEEMRTSSSSTLRMAMQWVMTNAKARQYGLVLWGHADGWMIKNNAAGSRPRQAYGQDRENDTSATGTWMNITDMARVLESLPAPEGHTKLLRFIFADCCCFQSVESDYELRNAADYIIASAAEIPGVGAPYTTVIPALFSTGDDFCNLAVDAYFAQVARGYREPMSVVKTSEMDNLAQATHTVLSQSLPPLSAGHPQVDSLIYYYDHTLFDMNDFILHHATADDYAQWKQAFNKAVPYSTFTEVWMANFVPYLDEYNIIPQQFRDFDATADRYGGVSMFVPQDPNSVRYYYRTILSLQNSTINQMQWYEAAGLKELGW